MPSMMKIHQCLLKLSSGNEIRTDVRLTDGRTDTWTSNVKPTYQASIVWRDIKMKMSMNVAQLFDKLATHFPSFHVSQKCLNTL